MNVDRINALWSELRFRFKAISRLYPGASYRYGGGGFFWDRTQPDYVQIILGDDARSVYVDQEMTLLIQAIQKEHEKDRPPAIELESKLPWPQHEHPIVQQNQVFDLLVAAACSDEDWDRDDVQDIYARMMGKNPLDRMVEAVSED